MHCDFWLACVDLSLFVNKNDREVTDELYISCSVGFSIFEEKIYKCQQCIAGSDRKVVLFKQEHGSVASYGYKDCN